MPPSPGFSHGLTGNATRPWITRANWSGKGVISVHICLNHLYGAFKARWQAIVSVQSLIITGGVPTPQPGPGVVMEPCSRPPAPYQACVNKLPLWVPTIKNLRASMIWQWWWRASSKWASWAGRYLLTHTGHGQYHFLATESPPGLGCPTGAATCPSCWAWRPNEDRFTPHTHTHNSLCWICKLSAMCHEANEVWFEWECSRDVYM